MLKDEGMEIWDTLDLTARQWAEIGIAFNLRLREIGLEGLQKEPHAMSIRGTQLEFACHFGAFMLYGRRYQIYPTRDGDIIAADAHFMEFFKRHNNRVRKALEDAKRGPKLEQGVLL